MNINNILYKYLLNRQSNEELEMLEEWKKESYANLEEFQKIQSKWINAEDLNEYHEYDSEAAWNKISPQIVESEPKTVLLPMFMKVAAGLLLVAAAVFCFYPKDSTPELSIVASTDVVLEKELEDFSNIWLNNNSSVDLTGFNKGNRTLKLVSGEVYFDIESDKENPFTVDMGKYSVKVLGTQFNIKKAGSEIYLHVTEGHVLLSNGTKDISVRAGEMVLADDISMSKAGYADENVSSWKTGTLTFKNTNLSHAVDDLAKHYNIDINLSKSVLDSGDCILNTSFTNESLQEMLKELETVYGIKYVQKENTVVITKTDC